MSSSFENFHSSSSSPFWNHDATYTSTHQPLPPDCTLFEPAIYNQALALLQPQTRTGTNKPRTVSKPKSNDQKRIPTSTPLPQHNIALARHDSAFADIGVDTLELQRSMQQAHLYNQSMGGGPVIGVKRQRSHDRTPSASNKAPSTGSASPHLENGSYLRTGYTEQTHNAPAVYADQAAPKNLPTPSQVSSDFAFSNAGYLPGQPAHMSNAHLAMKSFGFDHHNAEDYLPDFAPSRQSMSSYGNDSPATPQSGAGDFDAKQYNMPQTGYTQPNPNVQLFRTESQAYQDELYNPNATYTSAPIKAPGSYLSPHKNLITERLQNANLARSASPTSAISRERSPFRDGSPLAPSHDWKSQGGAVGTAANIRQQQKDQAAEAEFAQHQRATLRREPTKTISPKDAVLDYHDEQPSLFQDSIPAGYKQHMGGTEQWPTNNYLSQTNNATWDLSTGGQQNMSFRNATQADTGYSGTGFDFSSGLPQGADQIQNNHFQANYQAAVAAKMNQYSEPTPPFPATLPSMETSTSDAGLPASSQESTGKTTTPRRPEDTRANTGAYTCTYHGCTQRFDSHNNLQKHKRDFHRSQQPSRDGGSSSSTGSASPRSTESPDPSTAGMTSAAILARNSQAGPHKCTRINPSTNKPCNTIFSRPYDLTRHEDTIHNNRKQKVRCPMCREEKTFSRNDALTRHMRVVHPEVESFGKRGRRD